MTEPALASDGRVIGARAHQTRRRLLDATAKLLEERGALGLRVVDITREVGTSPATFYQYFPDVEEAILVLADEATDDIEALQPYILTPWNDEDGVVHVQEFVAAFMEYWDQHRVILRVRDLRAEEGDERFWAARRRGYGAIIPELTAKIEMAQAAGRVSKELNSYAAASGRDGDARTSAHLPLGVPPPWRHQGGDGRDARRHPLRDRHRSPELIRGGRLMARDIPRFVSVDDHVVEPPHLFQRWLPEEVGRRPALAPRRAQGHRQDGVQGRHHLRDRVGRHASPSPTRGSTRSWSRRTSATSPRSGSRATR